MKISKSAIFLFELMFVILVFTISAAICANIFGQSYNYSRDSKNLTEAILVAESAAEKFKAENGNQASQTHVEYFDKNWDPIEDKQKARHKMNVEITVENGLAICNIEIDLKEGRNASSFYELTAKKALGV